MYKRQAWGRWPRAIGQPELRMHDLRHAAAGRLLRSGVTLGVAAQVLGHDPAVLARRYGHLETAALRAAQEQAWKGAEVTLKEPQREPIVNVVEAV